MIKRIKRKQKRLGNKNKQLIIRLLKRSRNYYDVVVTRRKAKPTSRLSRLGHYQLIRNDREKYTVFSMDMTELRKVILAGAKMDRSFTKIIFN